MDDEQVSWFRERIGKERNFRELHEKLPGGPRPAPEVAWTMAYRYSKDSPEEKAYIGVDRLFRRGFFSDSAKPNEDSQLDIDNPYHQKILAFALKTFDSKKIPEALSSKVRFLQLHILSAYQDVYPNDVQFDEKTVEQIKTATGLFDKLNKFGKKVVALDAIGELLGLTKLAEPITKEQFQTIFGNAYSPEEIPALLNTGLNLERGLKDELVGKHLAYLQTQIAERPVSPTMEQPPPQLDPEEKAAVRSNIVNFLETAKSLDVEIPGEAQLAIAEQYEQALPTPQELAELTREVDTEIDRLQEAKIRRQAEIHRVVREVAQDLACAVHGWSQRTKNISSRKDRLRQTKGDFHAFVDALGIKEIPEFQNMSLRSIQSLLEHRIIAAQAEGADVLKEVTRAYEKDVKMTRDAIQKCKQQNRKLTGPHADLKQLGDMIISHERSMEKNFEKKAKGLRGVHILFDALKIAGAITSIIPGGQAAGLALSTAGQLGNLATGQVDNYNNRGWDAQYSWCMNRLSSIISAEEMLFNVNVNLQNWNQVLLGRKYDQEEFLLRNPQLFRPQAYLRNLRDAVIEARRNLENIDSQISQSKAKESEYAQNINRVVPEIGKSEKEMKRAKKKAVKNLNRKTARNLNRKVAAYSSFKTQLANLTAERIQNQNTGDVLTLQREEELQRLKAFEARLAEHEKIADLPDHHKPGAENMSLEELMHSSGKWVAKLELEYSRTDKELKDLEAEAIQLEADQVSSRRGRRLKPHLIAKFATDRKEKKLQIDEAKERCRASYQNFVDERIFLVQIQRQRDISQFSILSSSEHPDLIPRLREASNKRISSSTGLVFTQRNQLRELREKELNLTRSIDSLKKYEGLDPLTDKLTAEQVTGHRELGELKDELDATKAQRWEQEKNCKELDAVIAQEETYRDVQLVEAIDHLPLNQRIPCAQKSRDTLFAAYNTSYAQKQLELQAIDEDETKLRQQLDQNPLSKLADISVIEQKDAPSRRQANELLDQAKAKRHITLSEMQAINKAKLQETVRYCNLSHKVDMERWEQVDPENRKELLPAMQLSSHERHKLLTAAREENPSLKALLQAAEAEAKSTLDTAALRWDADTSVDKFETQPALSDAEQKYLVLRKGRQDADLAEELLKEKIAQNENILKRSYIEGYISEMQSTLRWLQMKQRDPADQALYDELRHVVQSFEQDNAMAHLGNFIDVAAWCAEMMRKTPYSPHERESYARLAYYCRTLSTVATLGVNVWGFHQLVQTNWAKKSGSKNAAIPEMGWGNLLIEYGLAFGAASMSDKAAYITLALRAIGMLAEAWRLWIDERQLIGPNLTDRVDGVSRQVEHLVRGIDNHFYQMEEHLNDVRIVLQEHQEELTEEVKADLKKLSQKVLLLSKLREEQIKQLDGKVQAGNLSTQQTLVTQTLSAFRVSCKKAQVWLHDPELDMAPWFPKYLETVKCFLDQAISPDITGRNKPGTVEFSRVAGSPHDYVGFLGNLVGLIVPSVPLFNEVAASLVRVGNAALQRDLPKNEREALREKVALACEIANRITVFANLLHQPISKTEAALNNLRKYYSGVLQKAEHQRTKTISSILDESIKHSRDTFHILAGENSQRFLLSRVVHETSLNDPSLQDRLTEHFKVLYEENGIRGFSTWLALLGGAVLWLNLGPPSRKATGFSLVGSFALLGIVHLTSGSSGRHAGNRARKVSQLMRTLKLGPPPEAPTTQIGDNLPMIPYEDDDPMLAKAEHLDVDFYSDDTGSFKIAESTLAYQKFRFLGSFTQKIDARGNARMDQSAPLVSATVRLFFGQNAPRELTYATSSLIQKEDIERIRNICSCTIQGDHYKDSSAFDKRVKELFNAFEELVTTKGNPPALNPLSAIAKECTFIPPVPTSKRMVPLALPTQFIDHLTEQLQEDLSFLHCANHGTLVPYYEFEQLGFKRELTLSIVFYHRKPDGEEEDFCRFSGVFALDRRTQNALEGICSDLNTPQNHTQASRILLYVMYGGFLGLGMPGYESYSLLNGGAVAPVDLPFEGFYQKLVKDSKKGIHFHTDDFIKESSPEAWLTPIEMDRSDGDKIIERVLEEEFRQSLVEMPKNPQFQAYEESYYLAMAHAAFIHSLKTNALLGVKDELVIEDAPAVEDLAQLFAAGGLPSPDKFEPFREMEKPVNTRWLLGQLAMLDKTVHCKTFAKISEELGFLLAKLNNGAAPLKDMQGESQPPQSISSRDPFYSTGKTTGESAYDWFALRKQKGAQAKASTAAVQLGEGKQFSVGDKSYYIAMTSKDGACGLHALLGEKQDACYFYPKSRKEFAFRLTQKIEQQAIHQLWGAWMIHSLKDHLGSGTKIFTGMVFNQISGAIDTLKTALTKLDQEKDLLQKAQEELFEQICQLDGFESSRALSAHERNNLFRENLNDYIKKLEGKDLGNSLVGNLEHLKEVEQNRTDLFETFIGKKEVWDAYINAIANPDYYFSIQEIGLAAYLFDRSVVVYGQNAHGKEEPLLEEGDPIHPKVVIFHKGLHFSRCEEIVPLFAK